jgi:hypothetical protein
VIVILFHDDADDEWQDAMIEIRTVTDQQANIIAAVWAATPRTLTVAANTTAIISGSDLTITRGDTLSAAITGLGSIADYTSIWFTVKVQKSAADTAAIIQIKLNATGLDDGLLYLNGAAADDSDLGAITIDDEDAGDITITLDETAADDLETAAGLYYDIQVLIDDTVTTLTAARCAVVSDVTRSIT